MGGDGGSPAGTLPGLVRTGATFADAAAEWLRYIEHDSQSKAVDRRRLVHCAQLVEGLARLLLVAAVATETRAATGA